MSNKDLPREYEFKLELANNSSLEMLMFSEMEHRWIFKNRYSHPKSQKVREKPTLINDTTLVVNYVEGVAKEINLVMDITNLDKRGQEYYLGVDISPNSHLNLEFIYERMGDLFRMKTLVWGVGKSVEIDSLGKGLVKPIDFPFPIKDRVENEFGIYRVPFLNDKDNDAQVFFEFPRDYRR
jgi:hypothetical protein